jgi:hypothetical protein
VEVPIDLLRVVLDHELAIRASGYARLGNWQGEIWHREREDIDLLALWALLEDPRLDALPLGTGAHVVKIFTGTEAHLVRLDADATGYPRALLDALLRIREMIRAGEIVRRPVNPRSATASGEIG